MSSCESEVTAVDLLSDMLGNIHGRDRKSKSLGKKSVWESWTKKRASRARERQVLDIVEEI